MANNNTKNDSKVGEMKHLLPTAFTVKGLAPVSSVFKLTPDQLKKEILDIAKTFIPDFTDCTLTHTNSAILIAYLWLPQNSEHLTDQIGDDKSLIRKPIFRYSNDFKEFMDKFCKRDNKRTFNEDRPTGQPRVAIEIDIVRFMDILFDTNGYQYSKSANTRPVRTNIELRANFTKDGRSNKIGAFTYLTVEKSLQNNYTRKEPTPRKSYNV